MKVSNRKLRGLGFFQRKMRLQLDSELHSNSTIIKTTNLSISDQLIELNRGIGNNNNTNDIGFIMNRGSTGNDAFFIWDEGDDMFKLGTTTNAHTQTGSLTNMTLGTLKVDRVFCDTNLTVGDTTVSSNDVTKITGITAGTARAGRALVVNNSKDISGIRNLSMTGDLTVNGTITCTKGIQSEVVERTATADGTGAGTIEPGTSFVKVLCDDAAKIIILPAPGVGNVIWLINDNVYELRTSDPNTISINGGKGVNFSSTIPVKGNDAAHGGLIQMICTSDTTWVGIKYNNKGEAGVIEQAH